MTRKSVTDEQYGQLSRRLKEVARRTEEGTLPFGQVMDALQAIIEDRSSQEPDIFRVVVDYTKTLVWMINNGCYGWVNSNITQEHFPPVDSEGKDNQGFEVFLLSFDKGMTSEQILAEMEKQNLRPARIEELLALGAAHQYLQRRFSIVALGSVWQESDAERSVPFLTWAGRERYLTVVSFDPSWSEGIRFAAVRK